MQANNKIMKPQNHIDHDRGEFVKFVQTIKDQRRNRSRSLNKSELISSQLSKQQHQGSSLMFKDLSSLGSNSFYFQRSYHPQQISRKYVGDQTLKNKEKYGVANRSTMKQYQFPPQYFTQKKLKIQEYLKESRLVPNVQVFPNASTPSPGKKQLFSQAQISMLTESKVLRGETNTFKFSTMDPNIVLKYCLLHRLSEDSNIKDILIFFVRLLQLLNYSNSEPHIQKYRDCVYFGKGLKKNQITEGFLYFFTGSVYIGQILDYSMHGRGTQIFFNNAAIYKGDFKEGLMYGYFQVSKDHQKYCGMIQNGVYHGHGKLQTRRFTVQGEFRQGKLVNLSQSLPKQHTNKNNSFRVRGNFRQLRPGLQKVQSQFMPNRRSFSPKFSNSEREIYFEFYPGQNSKMKSNGYLNYLSYFSSAFNNQMVQQGTQYQRTSKKASQINPQDTHIMKQRIKERQKLVGHFTNPMGSIREETDFCQEDALQLKI